MSKCNLKEHPDANVSSAKWTESVKGKEWKARGYEFSPKQINDKSTRIDSTPDMKGRASIKTKLSQKTPMYSNKKHKGEKPCCMLCQMCHNTDEKSSSIVVAHCDYDSKLKVRVLLDTGAL
jgi:hypothetical protein